MQCPQMKPTINVPSNPTPHPELENARGPAKSPDPREDFIKFAVDLTLLKK